MAQEFEYNMQLKQMEADQMRQREAGREDRKDDRVKLQANEQRKNKNFESSGNDIISGGIGLGRFEPS